MPAKGEGDTGKRKSTETSTLARLDLPGLVYMMKGFKCEFCDRKPFNRQDNLKAHRGLMLPGSGRRVYGINIFVPHTETQRTPAQGSGTGHSWTVSAINISSINIHEGAELAHFQS